MRSHQNNQSDLQVKQMNPTQIHLDRWQYGIGQGCFHAQRLRVKPAGGIAAEFRLVYDCGSKTKSEQSSRSPLEWAIHHFTGQKDPISNESKRVIRIDTLFVSHFHYDHIAGIAELAQRSDIREIVIPYLDQHHLASLLAQQVANGDLTANLGTGDVDTYLETMRQAASDEDVFGVPTTRVREDFEDQRSDNFPDETRWDIELGGEVSIVRSDATAGNWVQTQPRILTLQSRGKQQAFWQLVTWTWRQSSQITGEVINELRKLSSSNGNSLESLLNGTKVDPGELRWMIDNAGDIQKAYNAALASLGISTPTHNVLSLCLYSGPIVLPESIFWRSNLGNYPWFGEKILKQYRHLMLNGWLGTGDAELEKEESWTPFFKHFNDPRNKMITNSRTLLMPHHGSRNRNYNEQLLRGKNRIAVFSAGAFNQYGHPEREIIESVGNRQCYTVTVTEQMRPGFFETLVYNYPQP